MSFSCLLGCCDIQQSWRLLVVIWTERMEPLSWAEWLKHSGLRPSSIPILLSTCLQQMVSGHSRFTSRMPGHHFDSVPKLNSRHAACLRETRQAFRMSMWECSPQSFNKNLLTFCNLTSRCFGKLWACHFFSYETCKRICDPVLKNLCYVVFLERGWKKNITENNYKLLCSMCSNLCH